MPAIVHNGDMVLYFAAWKHHLGLYPMPRFDEPLETAIAPFRAAKDTVRFPYNKPIPEGLIGAITAALVMRRQ